MARAEEYGGRPPEADPAKDYEDYGLADLPADTDVAQGDVLLAAFESGADPAGSFPKMEDKDRAAAFASDAMRPYMKEMSDTRIVMDTKAREEHPDQPKRSYAEMMDEFLSQNPGQTAGDDGGAEPS